MKGNPTKPYTYYLFWTEPNIGYIGVRWANELPAEEDLWHIYKTSSRLVQTLAPRLGDPDVKLYWEHETAEEAQEHEKQLFDRLGDDVRENWMLNKCFHWRPIGGWNKGQKCPQISESKKGKPSPLKGRPQCEEANRKRSDALKGKPGNRKGKPHSEESRKKISEAKKGKILSDAHRKKIGESRKGKKLSEEVRAKMKGRITHSTPIEVYGTTFSSIREASCELEVSTTSLYKWLKTGRNGARRINE